jgi:uncharacterized protein (UPF0179 family)
VVPLTDERNEAMQVKTGVMYEVNHKRKGKFTMIVRITNENFTTGTVIEGKTIAFLKDNEIPEGYQTTVRNSFCEFKEVKISEDAKS